MPVAGEFDLIRRYFESPARRGRALLGIGDDCALLPAPDPGLSWAVSTDMLIEGRHFFADVNPHALGHKTLAVNLSDLAAMGARPVAFTLAMALPAVNEPWLEAFSAGLLALADRAGCELVGGDTTRGPLTLSVTVLGDVPAGQALRRDGARPGDDIWVSGELGGAAWAVAERVAAADSQGAGRGASAETIGESERRSAWHRLERPEPRVPLGLALRGVASAAIDLSDGLMGDLGHVLARSAAAARREPVWGAHLEWPRIPLHPAVKGSPPDRQRALALAGGDDYELLFCAPPSRRATIDALARQSGLGLHRIGRIEPESGLRLFDEHHRLLPLDARSYDHFR